MLGMFGSCFSSFSKTYGRERERGSDLPVSCAWEAQGRVVSERAKSARAHVGRA